MIMRSGNLLSLHPINKIRKKVLRQFLHFSWSSSELKIERQLTLFLLYLSVVHCKKPIQTSLNFVKEAPETQKLEVLWDVIVFIVMEEDSSGSLVLYKSKDESTREVV